MATTFTYFGGMCVLAVRDDGYKVLCDPYLSDNPAAEKGPEDLSDVDLLLVTHNAFDHFGDTIRIMENSQAILMAGGEVIRRVAEAIPGLPDDRLVITIYGDDRSFGGVSVRVVPTWHVSNCVINGATIANPPLGFIIEMEKDVRYYHAGDTSLFSDMKMIREIYRPNIMAVGISRISEKYPGEMTPREAAFATQWVGPDVVIPTHYAPGSEKLEQYISYVKVTSPQTVIKDVTNIPWTYTPFRID